jgi:DNA-binding IscR family transcriptional regulator
VAAAIKAADQAAAERLSRITVADILAEPELRLAS